MQRVIDGDTIVVRIKNDTHQVRLLGVDTPEPARNGRKADCYADEATALLTRLLIAPGGTLSVRLVDDPSQSDRDVYDRLLRYVEVDGVDVGAQLLRRGAAETTDDDPEVARHDDYQEILTTARTGKRGRWAACRDS